jgi:hypothetical protein
MKKPTLRVTKWLSDIPVEASCSVCAGVPMDTIVTGLQKQITPQGLLAGLQQFQKSLKK